MAREKPQIDRYSGLPWQHVTGEQARSLPMGQLNAVLWAIGLWFIVTGLIKGGLMAQSGQALWLVVIGTLLPLVTGLGLLARIPWALILAGLTLGVTLYGMVRGFQDGRGAFALIDTLITLGIFAYLLEGDRPNLIYRHRFRKYSARDGESDV